MNNTLELKQTVEHFDEFKIEGGRYIGVANGEEYDIKELHWDGTENNTYVTYYQDGEEIKILQNEGRKYMNQRIYGKEI